MVWKTIDRPGYTGKKKAKRLAGFDKEYGEGNWRLAWEWNNQVISEEFTWQLYEDGYYSDSFEREDLWQKLVHTAREVYDLEPRDIESGLDYHIQQGIATHLQDIAIRKVVQRRGWVFEGDELVRIRHHDNYWGRNLGPGKVPFHIPELILVPHLESWWDPDSIEDFYQSNKILQIKEK
ncbi:hypothetical protein ACFL96_13205 [Thermoproteota archaeon]